MPATTYTSNNVLNSLLRGSSFPVPSHVYVSLHTANPGLTGASEISTTAWPSYVRKDAANGGAVANGFTAPASQQSKNAIQLIWPVHDGAANVTASYFALWDAATGGNCLATGQLASARTIQPGDVFVLDTQKLTVTVN